MTDERPRPDDVASDGGSGSIESIEKRSGEAVPVHEAMAADPLSGESKEFLLEVVRRGPLLEALEGAPASASRLIERVEMSRSTVHRALDSLEELEVVRGSGEEYELTPLGRVLAGELQRFGERARTARSLSAFLNAVNSDGTGIPVEHLQDATVTRREPRQPHATIHRIVELFDRSDRVRMFSTVISPIYVDMAYPKLMDGTRIQAVFEQEVVDLMLSEYAERAQETIATGNFDVYAHPDELPFELFVFDDRIGMAAHDEAGIAEVLVESEDPAARAWALDLFEAHRSRAESLTLSDVTSA